MGWLLSFATEVLQSAAASVAADELLKLLPSLPKWYWSRPFAKEALQSQSIAADELVRLLASLDRDLEALRTARVTTRLRIDKAEQWLFRNADFDRLLAQLKAANLDAEDLIADFDYAELQQKIEGGQASDQLLSSSLDLLKSFISGGSAPDEAQRIRRRLDDAAAALEQAIITLNFPNDRLNKSGVLPRLRQTGSFVTEPKVFGRDQELKKVIAQLLLRSGDGSGPSNDENTSTSSESVPANKRIKRDNVSVLPIVGMGGMGKTTLAQLAYNDPKIKNYFEMRIWVCVSDFFDVERLTKEVINNASKGYQTDGKNLSSLQVLLNEMTTSKRFLLVLDDVWNEDKMEWQKFYAPMRNGRRGSMILTTTRSRKVADVMGAEDSVFLEGLPDDSFWEFFKKCALDREDTKVDQELESIGKKIAAKLKGSPLAAKTIGGLLNEDVDAGHWRTIMNSEIWELPQQENGILPALRLSYQYLPPHLKHCFSLCSIFPKDYPFSEGQLVDIWVAQGFVEPKENMPLRKVGATYLRELTTRSFFQPYQQSRSCYVMHDLMHDLAQLVLMDETIMIQDDKRQQRIPSTVRHMSIWTPNLETSRLMEFGSCSKLRSLLLTQQFVPTPNPQPDISSAIIKCWFDRLRNIRLLIINHCEIKEFPENISNLKRLRYLDISFNGIRRFPESLCRLYNLQVLAMYGNKFESFPKEFTKLTNLSKLYIEEGKLSMVDEIGKLTSLRSLPEFKVQKEHGHRIGELKDLMQLHGRLRITRLENVESREDACRAKLHNKEHLDELVLEWSSIEGTSSVHDDIVSNMEVLEGLRPHLNLKKLGIKCYDGKKFPNWLQPQNLPCLSVFRITDCPNLAELPLRYPFLAELELRNVGLDVLPKLWDEGSADGARIKQGNENIMSSPLSRLYIQGCRKIKYIENWLSPDYLPFIKSLSIMDCEELVSLPTERFKDVFVSLEYLKITGCPKLTCQRRLELPASIRHVQIGSCGELDKTLPNCLENLTSLGMLLIRNCRHFVSLPAQVLRRSTALSYLSIRSCPELRTLGGLEFVPSLNSLSIVECPKLAEAAQLISDATVLQGKSMSLSDITIDNTSLLKLPSPRNLLSSLTSLRIVRSSEPTMFVGEDEEWLQILASLTHLHFEWCSNIKSLPTWLDGLTSLELLSIQNCPEINSLPKKGLPTSLAQLQFRKCHPMLKEQLENLKAQNSRIRIAEFDSNE